jgi:hypothetical protein
MNEEIAKIVHGDVPSEYAKLPPCIQQYYTPQQWAWLSAREKQQIVQFETEPDY